MERQNFWHVPWKEREEKHSGEKILSDINIRN